MVELGRGNGEEKKKKVSIAWANVGSNALSAPSEK